MAPVLDGAWVNVDRSVAPGRLRVELVFVRERNNEGAVVLAVPDLPRLGCGGPLGLCYRLLDALSHSWTLPDTALYCLSLTGPRCYRIVAPEDLRRFVPAEEQRPYAERLRNWAIRMQPRCGLPLREAIELMRLTASSFQHFKLKPMLGDLFSAHRVVLFHAHMPRVAYKIVRAMKPADLGRLRLVITDHSKGGDLRQYRELVGPSAVAESHSLSLARQIESAILAADAYAFPSYGARELWEESNPALAPTVASKGIILYNGVSQPPVVRSVNNGDGDLRLFAIAQHVPEKGLDRMIRGVAELGRIIPDRRVHLRVAGDATRLTPRLESLCRDLAVEDRVTFLGRIQHQAVIEELSQAQVMVALPRVVVFDLGVLEGMALGKPIVTNSLPGNVEALGSQYPLFANDEMEFARKVALCCSNSELAAGVGRALRQRYEELFTSEAMALQHCQLYARLLGESSSAPKWTGQILSEPTVRDREL